LNVNIKNRGFSFIKCIVCEFLIGFTSKVGENNIGAKEHELKILKITNTKNHVHVFITFGEQNQSNPMKIFFASFMTKWII
jgi:hypothetical protein